MRTGGELGEQDPETSIRQGDLLIRVSFVIATVPENLSRKSIFFI